jgi:hypothetical protein
MNAEAATFELKVAAGTIAKKDRQVLPPDEPHFMPAGFVVWIPVPEDAAGAPESEKANLNLKACRAGVRQRPPPHRRPHRITAAWRLSGPLKKSRRPKCTGTR